MALTATHIKRLRSAAGASGGIVLPEAHIADLFNKAMRDHGGNQFNSKRRVAALLSECLMESAYFRTTVEYASSGPYQPWRGRTFIQITWKSNYQKFGKWCVSRGLLNKGQENYFADAYVELGRAEWAALGAVWYFTEVKWGGRNLCQIADAGNPLLIGRAVNLGNPYSSATPNGQSARNRAWDLVMSLPDSIVPSKPKPKHAPIHIKAGPDKGKTYPGIGPVSVAWINDRRRLTNNGHPTMSRHIWYLQKWLMMAGHTHAGTPTGFWNDATQTAYNNFRRSVGYRGGDELGSVGLESLVKLRAKAKATKKIREGKSGKAV